MSARRAKKIRKLFKEDDVDVTEKLYKPAYRTAKRMSTETQRSKQIKPQQENAQ